MSEGRRRFRITLSAVSIGALALTGAVLAGMEWGAEHFLPLWVLLFAPPALFIAPLVFLALFAAWRRRWRWLAVHLAAAAVVFFGVFRYRFPTSPDSGNGERTLTVVTHNIGQGNRLAFDNAFPGETPDAVLLQDANYRERDYLRRYPTLKGKGVGQFLLLTPHDVIAADLVQEALWRGKPVAARFVIRVAEREIALYGVHFPTPRHSLRGAFSPRVALEMLWIADASTDGFPSYRSWLDARIQMARQLREALARETLPVVLAGDLNTPDRGVIYRELASMLGDAHAQAGRGWGYTFPSDKRKDGRLARFFGPWLRLDYVFATPQFRPIECRVAEDDRSQHRAVLARLAFSP